MFIKLDTALLWLHRVGFAVICILATIGVVLLAGLVLEHVSAIDGFSHFITASLYRPEVVVGGVVAALISLVIVIPNAWQVDKLKVAHREFTIKMADVREAYQAIHEADRVAIVEDGEQFDRIRERMDRALKDPKLKDLRSESLLAGAQMADESMELARYFSPEKIEQAKMMVTLLLEQVTDLEENTARAHQAKVEINKLLEEATTREHTARTQLAGYRDEIETILETVGYTLTPDSTSHIVSLPKKSQDD